MMSFLIKQVLLFSLFFSWASCFTKFIRPPERYADQKADQDMTKNSQFEDGKRIPIVFETNIKNVDLYIYQVVGDIDSRRSKRSRLIEDAEPNPDGWTWKALYDFGDVTENKEDCIYWFEVIDGKHGGTLAESQYVNVSAPESDETMTTASATLTVETAISTTDTSSDDEASSTSKPSSESRLSQGQVAGVAVGATIGGLSILGGIGWMFWRTRTRRKNGAAVAELPGEQNQDQPYSERPKSELPAEPVVFPPERPKSPPRIYEAP